MQASSCEPCAQSKLTVAEDAGSGAKANPFGQGPENFCHAMGWGLEPIQDRAQADAELCPTSLTAEARSVDALLAAVVAAADQGMNLVIDDPEVKAVGIGTGVAGGSDAFL